MTYQFCKQFFNKKSVLVYASPDRLCLISNSKIPTDEDLQILNENNINYEDIKWAVEDIVFGGWNGSARYYK